jgi:cation diffusion facilitator CzcD-associated flavoprotein CzcO
MTAERHRPWAATGRTPRIAIIGAGMSGIAAVVKLRRAGYDDLTIFEKADRIGGTWRENTYPGLSCDVPSHWYSFTFEPNPDWSHRFSYGPEIQAYMERTARRHDVLRVVRFNTEVVALDWCAPGWRLTTGDGGSESFDIVIAATGILHHPLLPDIEGLAEFSGAWFHTARWRHDVALAGRRVGIIGTGSTASQVIGEIAREVGHLAVFQRTPQWMAPMRQHAYSAAWKRLLGAFPILTKASYWYYYKMLEWTAGTATTGNKPMQRLISKVCADHLRTAVRDPELRRKLTPDYQAACKRLILCSTFYPALARDNVDLVTDPIAHIEAGGIRTKDGAMHELDVLVLATGFDVAKFVLPTKVRGENGTDLEEFWNGAPRAHRSVAIPGFPNFWMVEGPTSPVGNISLITISELQIDYIIACLDKMKGDGLAAMAPRREAFDRYNAQMRQAVGSTVWATGGCSSWYIDKTGLPNLYPWRPRRFRREMKRPDFSEYRLIADPR